MNFLNNSQYKTYVLVRKRNFSHGEVVLRTKTIYLMGKEG